jgi:hypothetical protein
MALPYNNSMGMWRTIARRVVLVSCTGVLSVAALLVISPQSVFAAQLGSRSLQLGSATASATTTHTFTFSYATPGADVGSLVFEYCTSPLEALPCNAPAGLNASGAILATQSGETGFFPLTTQTNRIILTRAPAQPPTNNPSQYAFDNIVNPSAAAETFYARITTHVSVDGSDAPTDFGAVVNSTSEGVQVSSEVPPYLKFCVGLSVSNDCTSTGGNLIDLGDLSTNSASRGSSQMLAATNADLGLAIAVYGTTLTSGNNIIPPLAAPTVSAPGNAQFGINLRANTDPAGGQNPSGGGVANPAANYNTPNRYMFANGATVATSPDVTDIRKFTVSYVANISPSQEPGVYTATLTYICTATF